VPAKIILVDIETAPGLGLVWGKYDQNVIAFKRHGYMLSYAWKEYGQPEVYCKSIADYPEFNQDHYDDGPLVHGLWEVFDDADILVGHNGDAFDIKFANARFAVHNLNPPSTYKTVDTLKIARKHFRFESNKLTDLGQHLGLGVKLDSGGIGTWLGCMDGDVDAFQRLCAYNVQDVVLLENIYNKVRRWATNHPNVNLYDKTDGLCPGCGSKNTQRRGFQHAMQYSYQRLHCQDCGKWFKGKRVKLDDT
jgi:DNA polymerase elongation subunit (family B)